MSSLARRVIGSGWLWRSPALVVASILMLTAVMVVVQRDQARQRRTLMFEGQAGQVHQEIVEAIEREGERFRTAVDFVAVTHPGALEQFRAYFARQGAEGQRTEAAPVDFLVVEETPWSGFDALEQRERMLANADFAVRSMAAGPGDRLIVTRTSIEAERRGADLVGLDVTGLEEQFPAATGAEDYGLRVLEPGPSARLLVQLSSLDENATEPGRVGLRRAFAMFHSTLPDPSSPDPSGRSSAVRLVSIADLLEPVDRSLLAGLEASLAVDGIAGPVAVLTGPDGGVDGSAALRIDHDLATAGQRWSLTIAADGDYGPPAGVFDVWGTWAFGLTTAGLAGVGLAARIWHRRRLIRAERELASALTVASTDGLTGLLNRVGFVQQAAQVPDDEPVSVFFIDLDGFKAVNDLDGHEAGDDVLREVGNRLTRSVRSVDLVSRLGGDEFIVHVRGADGDHAADFASRMIDTIDAVDGRLSCSIGVALRRPGERVPVDELLRRADAAMYKVKRNGGRGYHLVRADEPPAGLQPSGRIPSASIRRY